MSQQTRPNLQTNINTDIADNVTGAITAGDVRVNMINMTDSVPFLTGSNAFDGATTITGSLTISGSIPALSIAPFIAIDPNLVVETVARLPPKLPIGVRTAATITTSFIIIIFMNLYLLRIYVNYTYFRY